MKKLCAIILVTLIWAKSVCAVTPEFLNELNKNQRKNLFEKKLVINTIKTNDGPWPRVIIYAVIDSDPFDAMAVCASYDQQKNYVPEVIKSKPIKHVTPTDVHVSYERKLPWPLANSHYTTGNKIRRLPNGGYLLEWYLVHSNSVETSDGRIRFIPYMDVTIIKYENFIKPNSFFASLLKNSMINDLKKTLDAIIFHIEEIKDKHPEKLNDMKRKILDAFQGKYVYKL